MATACKVAKLCQEKSDSESKNSCAGEDETQNEKPKTAFPPTDVTLEVEGIDIHLNKQVLMDKSPVLKAMFESDFSEKGKVRISLPGKKYGDFVNFLHTFYFPDFLAPITEKNVLEVAYLADEYQIMDLKDKCESFIIENCKRTSEEEDHHIETETLVDYAACAEEHHMAVALPFIIKLCSKHSTESLKQANIETKVTADTQRKILDVRCAFMEQEIACTLDKGEQNILQLMELAWEAQSNAKMAMCENRLVANCKQVNSETINKTIGNFTRERLLDYIIAAERYKLKSLLSSAVEVASKCNSMGMKNEIKYKKISSLTKYEIDTKRLNLLERCGKIESSYNLFQSSNFYISSVFGTPASSKPFVNF
ncbi:uncharacterized protein LOC133185122 [Saccostrea echinata]|uniref:uncharacterized protein LOC133185122 n=1 Tax=Saccostrea echinata TaxID=191078 RepID=UPI002A81C66C|nr:uncharacterized protein LOC133185122 [Saccostrea echinata]